MPQEDCWKDLKLRIRELNRINREVEGAVRALSGLNRARLLAERAAEAARSETDTQRERVAELAREALRFKEELARLAVKEQAPEDLVQAVDRALSRKVGLFLEGLKEQAQGYYPLSAISWASAEPAGPGRIGVVLHLRVENQHWCPGLDLVVREQGVELRPVRASFDVPGRAMVPAKSAPDGTIKAVLDIAPSTTLWLSDGRGSVLLGAATGVGTSIVVGGPPATSSAAGTSGAVGTAVSGGSGSAPPNRSTTITPAAGCKYVLCIHSNAAGDAGDGLIAGHAWLTLHDGATGVLIASYGAWPDDHPNISQAGLSNGAGSDVRKDYPGDRVLGVYYYSVCIDEAGKQKLEEVAGRNYTWGYSSNCAEFASDTFLEVTGVDVDADDEGGLGVETPREIGDSVRALNGGTNRPAGAAQPAAGGGSTSSSGP